MQEPEAQLPGQPTFNRGTFETTPLPHPTPEVSPGVLAHCRQGLTSLSASYA